MKRILLASIILTSMAALLASCSCGSNSKETSEAELNDSTKTAIEMENKRIEEPVFEIRTTHGTMKVKLYS
jgi:hypothetical protein